MLILTGPTASGKNTIGSLLARRRERCAVVDFDLVRGMFVQPHHPPWAGEEGKRQQMLGVRLACDLAAGFADADWEVIILDVLSIETVQSYRHLLVDFKPKTVQLLSSLGELRRSFMPEALVSRTTSWRTSMKINLHTLIMICGSITRNCPQKKLPKL